MLVRLIGRRAFVPLSDSNMATVLERRFPNLDDSLLTAVVLAGRRAEESGYNPNMLAHTCREATQRIEGLELARVFNPRPLRRSLIAAVLLLAGIVAFAVALPDALDIWAHRALAMSDQVWPRKTKLAVPAFENGPVKVASGGEIEVIATADTRMPLVPETVQIRYRVQNGPLVRHTMNRLGSGSQGKQHFQEYSYTFRDLLASTVFDVVGGDDRVTGLRIEVVKSPTLVKMDLDRQYPKYMERTGTPIPVTGVMQIPMGTRLTLHARANKELGSVQIDFPSEQKTAPAPKVLESGDLAADRMGFSYVLPPLMQDSTLLFTLRDTDGISSREPVRLALVAVPDTPPQLTVRLAGIGSAITPKARLPVAGEVSDDYGIGRVWFEYAIDAHKPDSHSHSFPAQASHRTVAG